MNLLPVPSERPVDLGRASELVSAVTPARKSRDAVSERQQAERSQSNRVVDTAERESLMAGYAQARGKQDLQQAYGQNAQRALAVYNDVSSQGERDALANMLGISEYA